MTIAVTPNKVLTAAVAPAGTFTLDYPTGYGRGDFGTDAPYAKLKVGANIYDNADTFALAFGASSITVTWTGTGTIAVGTEVRAQLDVRGASDKDPSQISYPPRVAPSADYRLRLGAPVATSATYFRAAAAIGGAGALTLLQTTLDVPRNIIITNAGDDTGDTYAVVGTDEYGAVVKETITGANAGVAAGKKAFQTITSITASGASAGNVSIGFGNVLGLPIWVPSSGYIVRELVDGLAAAAGTFVGGLARATKSTATTADVRGTYVPNSAPDAAKVYDLVVRADDPTYKGNPQFAG